MKKHHLIVAFALIGLAACNRGGLSGSSIENTVETFRKALVEADANTLNQLTTSALSYGHSSGLIESKDEFIATLVNGTSNFLSIQLSNQEIATSGDVAVVRHQLDAETEDEGKPRAQIRLHVLTVWQQLDGQWKLLTRQAVKMN